jgi:hypothetical protein
VGQTWRFGRCGLALSAAAAVWLVGEFINIAWPRASDLPWYQNWAVELGIGAFIVIGAVYFAWARPDRRFTTAAAAEMAAVAAAARPAELTDAAATAINGAPAAPSPETTSSAD